MELRKYDQSNEIRTNGHRFRARIPQGGNIEIAERRILFRFSKNEIILQQRQRATANILRTGTG